MGFAVQIRSGNSALERLKVVQTDILLVIDCSEAVADRGGDQVQGTATWQGTPVLGIAR